VSVPAAACRLLSSHTRWGVAACLLAWCWLAAGCGEVPGEVRPPTVTATPPRAGRFGSLRDLVLFERTAAPGDNRSHWLFVDRFEVTRGDWAAFAASPEGAAVGAAELVLGGEPSLPASRMDLRQARAFAQWRFARLPRLEEWQFVTSGDGRHLYPWGGKVDATRANTGELGIGEVLPVGTFESGRRAVGWPYDLVGNVSEWTESVPLGFWFGGGGAGLGTELHELQRDCQRLPALAVWQLPGGCLPPAMLVLAGGDLIPREVVGADFQSPMTTPQEAVLAGDRRQRTGLRLYATPRELLRCLLDSLVLPTGQDFDQLRRFLGRGRHREVMVAALLELEIPANGPEWQRPLGRWLQAELLGEASGGGR
jgi:hypothetical protein